VTKLTIHATINNQTQTNPTNDKQILKHHQKQQQNQPTNPLLQQQDHDTLHTKLNQKLDPQPQNQLPKNKNKPQYIHATKRRNKPNNSNLPQ